MAGGRKHASNIVRVCREGTWTEGWVCKMWTSGCEYGELWSDWRLAVACSCGGCKYGTSRRRWGICGGQWLDYIPTIAPAPPVWSIWRSTVIVIDRSGEYLSGVGLPGRCCRCASILGLARRWTSVFLRQRSRNVLRHNARPTYTVINFWRSRCPRPRRLLLSVPAVSIARDVNWFRPPR